MGSCHRCGNLCGAAAKRFCEPPLPRPSPALSQGMETDSIGFQTVFCFFRRPLQGVLQATHAVSSVQTKNRSARAAQPKGRLKTRPQQSKNRPIRFSDGLNPIQESPTRHVFLLPQKTAHTAQAETPPETQLSDGHNTPEANPLAAMLGRNLAQLQQDPTSRKAVRREWLKYFEQHPIADLRHYYTFLFPILEQAAAQQWQQWQGLDEFAALFAQRKFIAERYDNTRQTGEVLAEYGAQLAKHLAAATAAPLPSDTRAANWLGSLLDLYFHHSTHDQPENLTPAAALVRPYLQRFPEQYSGFFESYLEQAPDPAAAFATLLALGAQNRQDYCLSQMFGDGDTDSFPYRHAAAILQTALPQCGAAQIETLQQQVLEEFELTENGASDIADTRPASSNGSNEAASCATTSACSPKPPPTPPPPPSCAV